MKWFNVMCLVLGIIGIGMNIRSCADDGQYEYATNGQVVKPTHLGVQP